MDIPGTLQENSLFGERYDENKMSKVIQACALTEDISRFSKGLLTFVGERGVVLSGGQRTRVSLARAVYADADIYLLDDPLSTVDIKVSEHLFNRCICQLLRDKIRIMVTHDKNHMKAADQIIILEKGTLLRKGTFSELDKNGDLKSLNDSSKWYIDRTIKDDYRDSVFQDNMPEHLKTSEEDREIGTVSSQL